MKQKSWISNCVFLCFTVPGQNCPVRFMCNHQCGCRTDTLLECLPDYHALYRGSPVMAEVWKWCWIGLGAYAIRFLLYGISTSLSHISAYTILENIRLTLPSG